MDSPDIMLDPTLFKAYDIRGTVPQQLNPDVARMLGLAFGQTALAAGETQVAVGRDGRLSGPMLAEALIQGLLQSGIDVLDIGRVTTPMLYFAASTLCRSGIQITGSHNPKDDNGFKMMLQGQTLHGEAIQALHRTITTGVQPAQTPGQQHTISDLATTYQQRIISDIQLQRPLKIVVDSGNGVAGESTPRILRALGCEVIELYSEVDGNFPHHHPDPGKPENLQDLLTTVQATGAELGLALDGDGDRLGVVTRTGQIILPDRLMMLFARDVLSRQPGSTIMFDVKCSQQLGQVITQAGGQPLMYKTGHSLIKAKMPTVASPLGGEMSGHFFFRERWYGFDDATYAACRLLEILSRSPDADSVLNALPQTCATPEINIPCAEGEPHQIVTQLQANAEHTFVTPARVNIIDGVRIDWPDGFGLIRASNTTPVLVLRFEGLTPEALTRIQHDMLNYLLQVKPDAQIPDLPQINSSLIC